MSDDDDVPPLEDMSDMLKETEAIRTQATASPQTNPIIEKPKDRPSEDMKSEKKSTVKAVKSQTFGGMKKGFLFGGPAKKPAEPSQTADIPLIKPAPPEEQKDPLRIPEVEQAMKANPALLQDESWVTDDLLTRISRHPRLMTAFTNPRMMAALNEFQTDPEGAQRKYQDQSDVQNFLKDFCSIMGDHFINMADSQSTGEASQPAVNPAVNPTVNPAGADMTARSTTKKPVSDDPKVNEILSDLELTQILIDSDIQKLMESLRHDPQQAERILQQGGPELHKKVKKLVDKGLLQIQR